MPWLLLIGSNVALAALVALAAWIVQTWGRAPFLARALWLLVLIKLVTPPLFQIPLGATSGATACALGTCACGPHTAAQSLLTTVMPWSLGAIWLAGFAVSSVNAWLRWRRFGGLLAHAAPAGAEWETRARQVSEQLQLRRPPRIVTMPGKLPPLVIPGWRRATLVLPAELLGQLDDSQRTTLLLHELIHIQRGDHLMRLMELFVRLAYWWLPAAGRIGQQLRACEEACCDLLVVGQLPQARRHYARLLLDVVDFVQPPPLRVIEQATAMGAMETLQERLHAILGAAPIRRTVWPARVLAIVAAGVILPCSLNFNLAGRAAGSSQVTPVTALTRPAASNNRREVGELPEFQAFCCPK